MPTLWPWSWIAFHLLSCEMGWHILMQQHVWVNHAALSWNIHIFTLKLVPQLFLFKSWNWAPTNPEMQVVMRIKKPLNLELLIKRIQACPGIDWFCSLKIQACHEIGEFCFLKILNRPRDQTKRFSWSILKMAKPENLWFPVKYKNHPTLVSTRRKWMLGFVHPSVKLEKHVLKRI